MAIDNMFQINDVAVIEQPNRKGMYDLTVKGQVVDRGTDFAALCGRAVALAMQPVKQAKSAALKAQNS